MVKRTQIICRQQPINCLSVIHDFVGLALKGLIHSDWAGKMKSLIEFNPIPGGVSDMNSSGWGGKSDHTLTSTTISKMYQLSFMKSENYST